MLAYGERDHELASIMEITDKKESKTENKNTGCCHS